jgi:hypothetical protein
LSADVIAGAERRKLGRLVQTSWFDVRYPLNAIHDMPLEKPTAQIRCRGYLLLQQKPKFMTLDRDIQLTRKGNLNYK